MLDPATHTNHFAPAPFIAATIERFDGTALVSVCLWWLDGNIWKHKCLEEWETASRGAKKKADKAVEAQRRKAAQREAT